MSNAAGAGVPMHERSADNPTRTRPRAPLGAAAPFVAAVAPSRNRIGPCPRATVSARAPARPSRPRAAAQGERITAAARRRVRAFSLVELLVVIAIIGLLVSLVSVVASKAIDAAKRRNTEAIMSNVRLAIDVFASENPLRPVYDLGEAATFGPYPPYQLANRTSDFTIARVVEPRDVYEDPYTGWDENGENLLSDRLLRDLGGRGLDKQDYVRFGSRGSGRQANEGDGNDDIRGLYAYLSVFSPRSVDVIPPAALRPLNANRPDYVNPRGEGPNPGRDGSTWQDVLGIHDGWGVPLDYLMYVKVEWGLKRVQAGTNRGEYEAGWKVVERRPVLRSRGVDRETYDLWNDWTSRESNPAGSPWNKAGRWIFSEPLPQPWARLAEPNRGELQNLGANPNFRNRSGWLRLVGVEAHGAYAADYRYLPSDDPN